MWAQIINAIIGAWLMAAPAVFGYRGTLAGDNDYIVSPLICSFAIVAIWEITRPVRWLNLPIGLWLIVASFIFSQPAAGCVNGIICGVLVIVLSLVGGKRTEHFGGGWMQLWNGATS